jgi:hypothetical protein
LAADLAAGELAINTTDEKLYFENTGGTVTLLASSAATGGTFTTVTATTVVNGLGLVGTPSYTFTGDLNTGMWSPAADTVAVSTAGAEVLRLTAAGLVGISDGTPTRKLTINAIPAAINQLNGISINSAGSATSIAEFLLGTDGSGIPFTSVRTGNDGNSFMNFFTGAGPAERMRITAAGNVGIGTSAPIDKLQVLGSIVATGNGINAAISYADVAIFGSFTNHGAGFYTNSTEKMRIDTSGNALLGTTSSAGVATNTAKLIGGVFATVRSSLSVASATPTTIVTLPSGEGNYIVSASLQGSTDPANYNEVAVVSISASASSIAILVNASTVSLTMSGLDLQVTQNQGATQTIQFSVLRIL